LKRLEEARHLIDQRSWGRAIAILQSILDSDDASFVQREKPNTGDTKARVWVRAKREAGDIIGNLPAEGMQVYRNIYGKTAAKLLENATATGNTELMKTVCTRFFHTQAGVAAATQLAYIYLDKDEPAIASLYFERILAKSEPSKLSNETLFKAALSFKRSGLITQAAATWNQLKSRIGPSGLQISGKTWSASELREQFEP
jgi:hypothetical protein